MSETENKLTLSLNQLFSSFCALLLVVISAYIEIKVSDARRDEKISANTKRGESNDEYKEKVDAKLDQIIQSINRMNLEQAKQRNTDMEKKLDLYNK